MACDLTVLAALFTDMISIVMFQLSPCGFPLPTIMNPHDSWLTTSSQGDQTQTEKEKEKSHVSGKRPAARPAKATSKPKVRKAVAAASTTEEPGVAPVKAEAKDKAAERLETILTQTQKTKDLLVELTPDTLWRSLVRSTELDRRLGKVPQAERDLQKVACNEKADKGQKARAAQLQDELENLSDCVGAMKQAFLHIRQGEPASLAQDIASGQEMAKLIGQCANKLFTDFSVLIDIIQVIAKKLVDVPGIWMMDWWVGTERV